MGVHGAKTVECVRGVLTQGHGAEIGSSMGLSPCDTLGSQKKLPGL